MAQGRIVKNSFWTDPWIFRLTSPEKLLYLFLISNPNTGLSGVYEMTDEQIAHYTRLPEAEVSSLLQGFVKANKVLRHGDWIAVFNVPKHQQLTNPNMVAGLERELSELPDGIWQALRKTAYSYPLERLEERRRQDPRRIHERTVEEELEQRETAPKVYPPVTEPAGKPQSPPIPYQEIIAYLNKRTGRQYSPTSKASQKHIRARWNEGHRVHDFYAVIDGRCQAWLADPKMQEYLRPETLFGTKFDTYLAQTQKVKATEPALMATFDPMAPDESDPMAYAAYLERKEKELAHAG